MVFWIYMFYIRPPPEDGGILPDFVYPQTTLEHSKTREAQIYNKHTKTNKTLNPWRNSL